MRPQFLSPLLAVSLAAQSLAGQAPVQPLPEAVDQYLDAWDLREGNRPLPVPVVARGDRAALKWLVAAANQALPANPFPSGSPAWREAEDIRRLLLAPKNAWAKSLKERPFVESGSFLALWRWGQPKARNGNLERPLRHLWEDRLLEAGSPGVVRGLALRHAFCFALAEGDTERFSTLKDRHEDDFKDLFPGFQRAFALLGAPAPVVHLWSLPGLTSVDLPLSSLGGRRLRFEMDPGKDLPVLPPGTVWIVPTTEGRQPDASSYLEGSSLEEAKRLVPRLQAAGRTAFLAPSRSVFEAYALMYFPIQIELDEAGNIRRILMGDAARATF